MAKILRTSKGIAGLFLLALLLTSAGFNEVRHISLSNTPESYFSIWAEENSGLGNSTYEWAYGNGANTPSNRGVVVYVPDGYTCELVAVGLSINAGTATVEVNHNGVNLGSAANCEVSSGTNNINTLDTPVSVVNGDIINFRTTTASGTSAPCQAVAWFKLKK